MPDTIGRPTADPSFSSGHASVTAVPRKGHRMFRLDINYRLGHAGVVPRRGYRGFVHFWPPVARTDTGQTVGVFPPLLLCCWL